MQRCHHGLTPMNPLRSFAASATLLLAFTSTLGAQMVQKPYLQLGDHPRLSSPEALDVVWLAADRDEPWAVELRNANEAAFTRTDAPTCRKVEIRDLQHHRVCTAHLTG